MGTTVHVDTVMALNPCHEFEQRDKVVMAWGGEEATWEIMLDPPNVELAKQTWPDARKPTPEEGLWVLVGCMTNTMRGKLVSFVIGEAYKEYKGEIPLKIIRIIRDRVYEECLDEVREAVRDGEKQRFADAVRHAFRTDGDSVKNTMVVCRLVDSLNTPTGYDEIIAHALGLLKGEI
jgi:hypothetical protein